MLTEYVSLLCHALEQLPPQDLPPSNVYVSTRPYPAGSPVPVGRQTVTAPETCLLLFVDLVPAANWGHPCKYLLVGTETGNVHTFDAQFPPPREGLRIFKRAEDASEWTLLTKSTIED